MRLLALRGRTTAEVRRLLTRRGHGAEEVEAVLARLIAGRYLDDAEYAASYVRTRGSRRALGPARLAAELRGKGVGEREIAAALEAQAGAEAPEAAAGRAAARKWRALRGLPPEVARRRLAAHLERQGFPVELVLKICRTYAGGDESAPPAERLTRR